MIYNRLNLVWNFTKKNLFNFVQELYAQFNSIRHHWRNINEAEFVIFSKTFNRQIFQIFLSDFFNKQTVSLYVFESSGIVKVAKDEEVGYLLADSPISYRLFFSEGGRVWDMSN